MNNSCHNSQDPATLDLLVADYSQSCTVEQYSKVTSIGYSKILADYHKVCMIPNHIIQPVRGIKERRGDEDKRRNEGR